MKNASCFHFGIVERRDAVAALPCSIHFHGDCAGVLVVRVNACASRLYQSS